MPLLCSPPLSADERRQLLILARRAVTEAVSSRLLADFPDPIGRLAEPGSAFVTIHCGGRLRGCVGRTDRALALSEVVVQCAIGAALHDRRFRELHSSELASTDIEISVLSELQPVVPEAIEVGKHGIVVGSGDRRGLLLPQVAAERGWSVEQFLRETCQKAGLDADAWTRSQTQIWAFTTEAFSEKDLVLPPTVGQTGS